MPQYLGESDYEHGTAAATGVLVVNLGTPDSPDTAAVRRYLRQFLSDPRVIDLPRWLWLSILNGVILQIRPARSAAAYRKIWTPEGSPLLTISERLTAALRRTLNERRDTGLAVELGMTYGNPSIAAALEKLRAKKVRRLIVLPLYPQYSGATTGSVFDQLATYFRRLRWIPEFSFVTHYHDRPDYIAAVTASVREHWQASGRGERLLLSFHGLPQRYLASGDPYHCHCQKTARLLADALGLDSDECYVAFQSRVGREEWLRPYTDEILKEWGGAGVGDIDVVCPGFAVDCLETLEEIALRNRDDFAAAGGGDLRYIACLNDTPAHIALLAGVVTERLGGWPDTGPVQQSVDTASRERAFARGATL